MTPIPRRLFSAYLAGRRAVHEHWHTAICPYGDESAGYWREGFEDARIGKVDRYKEKL